MRRNILSINNNRSMNFLLRTVFSKHLFTSVNDVYQAMKELKQKNFDAIIVDMDYHKEENIDFIQHIQTSNLFKVPIIVLSSERNEMLANLDIMACSLFFKPFSPIDMLAKVEELITDSTLEKVN